MSKKLSWQKQGEKGAYATGAGGHGYAVYPEPDGTYGAEVTQPKLFGGSTSRAHLGYHPTKEAAQQAAERHNLPYTSQ